MADSENEARSTHMSLLHLVVTESTEVIHKNAQRLGLLKRHWLHLKEHSMAKTGTTGGTNKGIES